jgi:hypothetical protein
MANLHPWNSIISTKEIELLVRFLKRKKIVGLAVHDILPILKKTQYFYKMAY